MDNVLTMIGLTAVAILIIYIIKEVDDYSFEKNTGTDANDKVYEAAGAFARGESADAVRDILINSIDFDEEDIEEVLSLSALHSKDPDGGYEAFLKAARSVSRSY